MPLSRIALSEHLPANSSVVCRSRRSVSTAWTSFSVRVHPPARARAPTALQEATLTDPPPGNYPLPPGTTPILGVEFSGVVEETTGQKFAVGDEVFGLAFGGAYAEYIAVAEGMVTKKPEGVSWVHAA